MKRLLCLSILISILLLSSCENNNNPEEIVKSALEEFVASNSISYDIVYKNKYFNKDDTTELEGNCIIIREPKDSIFGGCIGSAVMRQTQLLKTCENQHCFHRKITCKYKLIFNEFS